MAAIEIYDLEMNDKLDKQALENILDTGLKKPFTGPAHEYSGNDTQNGFG